MTISVPSGPPSADPVGTSLGEALRRHARERPDRPAVVVDDDVVTWRELDARTDDLAERLVGQGVAPGSFVTILLPNGHDVLQAMLATWKLGAVPQPLSPRAPHAELDAIVDLVGPALVVADASRHDGRLGGRPCWHPSGPGRADEPRGAVPDRAVPPAWKAPASGGSTGRPKVIVAGEPGIVEDLALYTDMYRMDEYTVLLCTGPLHHNGPLNTALLALLAGGTVVVMPRFEAACAVELVRQHRVTWLYLVPTMMSRISRLVADGSVAPDWSTIRMAMHTAAPCSPALKREWVAMLGARLVEIYGGTEAQMMTFVDGLEWERHPGSVGRPIFGEVKVGDDDGRGVAAGETGLVWMRRGAGAPPTYRYLGAEPRRDADGWESIGDHGRLDEEGYLYLGDRASDLVLVGGANVYPAELEAALEEHPAVASACVVGLPHEDLGEVPHAVVQVTADVTVEELDAHLGGRVSAYKRARSFSFVAAPLRDETGKVRRTAVREQVLSGEVTTQPWTAARSAASGEASPVSPAVNPPSTGTS